jgi:5-methylcytosine-specific restriction endonuclease McrA
MNFKAESRYPGLMPTESHACVLDRPYSRGVMGCACGRLWMRPPREFLQFSFVRGELLARLRRYKKDMEWGNSDSLAESVAAAAFREREQRGLGVARLAISWPHTRKAKRAEWERRVRPIVLARPCAYCGGTADSVDHVMPVSRGGSCKMRNLAAACRRCNSEKGKRTPAEWKAWRLARGRSWPPPAA